MNIVQTLRKPSLRIWRKDYSKAELDYLRKEMVEAPAAPAEKKPVKAEHIRDLALLVNTGGFYRPEEWEE